VFAVAPVLGLVAANQALQPSPTSTAVAGSPSQPPASTTPVDPSARPEATRRPDDSPAPSVTPGPAPTADVPDGSQLAFVPVVGFWSADTSIALTDLERALLGRSSRYVRVVMPSEYSAAIADALGITISSRVEAGSSAEVVRAVRQGALGLLAVTAVTPAVRALAIDGVSLFGNERSRELEAWPLMVRGADGDEATWDEEITWTLVAGGDVQLDRWMAFHVTELDKGVDWPYDGGTVRITGRVCCSDLGHRVPEYERTGNEGAVRRLFEEADLAMANLEAAAVSDSAQHKLGPRFRFSLSFSGDPRLLEGLDNAGFDFLSLANNHIHNGGPEGITDTRRALERLGIDHAGAGRDAQQAKEPAVLDAAGQTVAVLSCTTIGRIARADAAGAAPCSGTKLLKQIANADAEADIVIVFPHWGREYRATPNAAQRALAREWVEAGADLVLGAHPHWAGAMEQIDGRLIFYSLGNLAFDQPWSEPTMQGLIVELTFNGDRLVQAWLHPTLIVEEVQPNLLEHDGGGARVMRRVREASDGLLPY
jgi:poly-gamma-glutamate capsule biosynthesis protein CapA/YwtB (metallophosphatase superfamily)